MPALWYHTGPLAGKIRTVDAETARRDLAAGIAQDMARPGGPLKRATYTTRDMRAAPAPASAPATPEPPPPGDDQEDKHHTTRRKRKSAESGTDTSEE